MRIGRGLGLDFRYGPEADRASATQFRPIAVGQYRNGKVRAAAVPSNFWGTTAFAEKVVVPLALLKI